MAKLFGRAFTRAELLARVGDVSQVAGVRRVEFAEGPERGVGAVEFRTGSGLSFTALIDRGLDIAAADWRGRPLAWRSASREVHPDAYDPVGLGWLRSFAGGLLVTCGMTNIGYPCEDKGESLGLHGRVSNLRAFDVATGGRWDGDEYVMFAEGSLREARIFGENLLLRRRISAQMGGSCLRIDDVVTNEGPRSSPLMLLYHVNPGFPVVDDGARLIAPSRRVIPRKEIGARELDEHAEFIAPTHDYDERVYFHQVGAAKDGWTGAAVANMRKGDAALGLYVRYDSRTLPWLIEWKMMGEQEYVVGIEPATNTVEGRAEERRAGRLRQIEPGEAREFHVEIGVLPTERDVNGFAREMKRLAAE